MQDLNSFSDAEDGKLEQCPCCKNNLKKVYYIGSGKPPTKEGFYNAKDWTTSKKKYREFLNEVRG